VRNSLAQHWFLAALLAVLTAGIGCTESLAFLTRLAWLRPGIIASVMFLMALPLEVNAFGRAVRHPRAPMLGIVINAVLVPMLAWCVVAVLRVATDCSEDTMFGILIAATVPCTLASASVWTRRAGGNDAVSIMVTIVTNSLCFLIAPAWLLFLLGKTPNFDPLAMVGKLGLLVVLPIVIAQCLRTVRSIGTWATQRKASLGVMAQCGVLLMVLLGAITTGGRLSGGDGTLWSEIAVGTLAVLSIHLTALLAGMGLARLARVDRRDAIAVGLAGSQKTLPVGVEICAQLGVTILPMFAYHVGQLVADTVVADRLLVRSRPD
jgi:sodium/bile acid cotransporter 7